MPKLRPGESHQHDLKPVTVNTRVTIEEMTHLDMVANRLGMKRGDLLRRLIGLIICVDYPAGERIVVAKGNQVVKSVIGL